MSSFIVDNIVINRIVTSIDRRAINPMSDNLLGELFDFQPWVLGTMMRLMNEDAVRSRYPNSQHLPGPYRDDQLVNYEYQPVTKLSLTQVYKDLSCYLYQCTEGDIPACKLFKQLQAYRDGLAHKIVAKTPDYNQATWN